MFWVLKNRKKADMDLIPYRLFSIVAPPSVVSKCALAGKQKPPLCKGRWHGISRDGGIVKVEFYAKTILQSASLTAPFTQGSLWRYSLVCRLFHL